MVDSTSDSQIVELAGYGEVLQRERQIRADAFATAAEVRLNPQRIGGIAVKPLTLGLLIFLERARAAYVSSWRFDSGLELAVESSRFVWLVSRLCEEPRGRWHIATLFVRRWLVSRHLAKRVDVVDGIKEYLDAGFYDAPKGGGSKSSGEAPRSFCHYVALIVDTLVAAGYSFTEDQIMDLPLARLWQYYNLACHRLDPKKPRSNPSDNYAVQMIEERNRARQRVMDEAKAR